MLTRLLTKPLRLELEDRVLHFDSLGDFEFALSSRTEVPAAKVAELMRYDSDALAREARSIRAFERRLIEVIARGSEETERLDPLLRALDPKLFSQDHRWREVMRALASKDRRYDDFKRVALAKYAQYLGARQDLLRSLDAARRAGGGPVPGEEGDPRSTLLFAAPAEEDGPRAGFQRLPRGESLELELPPDGAVELVLSRHLFRLLAGDPPRLVDDQGRPQPLDPGRNTVGRSPDGNVVVDASYQDVSRLHLVIQVAQDGRRFAVTDLSAHGTFLKGDPSGRAGS